MFSRFAVLFCCLGLALFSEVTHAAAQTQKAPREELFARLTFGILEYVDWPDKEQTTSAAPLRIGLYDKTSGRKYLLQFSKLCDGNPSYQLVELSNTDIGDENLDVVYIAGDSASLPSKLLKSIEGQDILVVGEHQNILQRGGMIRFQASRRKNAELTVNLKQAKACGLNIRSRLLKNAKEVIQ